MVMETGLDGCARRSLGFLMMHGLMNGWQRIDGMDEWMDMDDST